MNSLIATSPINKPKYRFGGCKEYENKGISSKNVEIEDFHIKKGPDKDAQLSYIKRTLKVQFDKNLMMRKSQLETQIRVGNVQKIYS